MELLVSIKKDQTLIQNKADNIGLTIHKLPAVGQIHLGMEERKIQEINTKLLGDYEQVITISNLEAAWDIDEVYILQYLIDTALEGKIQLKNLSPSITIPSNLRKPVAHICKKIITILESFGYKLEKEKNKAAKAQHKWSKEVAQIDFFVDFKGASAVCRWQKRNEMLIKKGARLLDQTPLNKDGSIGFAAKFTQSIREMHQEKIKDFVTTDDIILKSVNEVGNFLYFAGTNSWLVLKDKDGKTIDEYTVVN